MSFLQVAGLTKRFTTKPPTVAIDDLDFEIEQGEFLVLLGPSGCGKTTTLRCLAGLETADAGTISLGGRTWFDSSQRISLPPEKRNIGMVFQSYALWPHMTVRKNINYPLKARRRKHSEVAGWVEEAAALVECENLLDRYPSQLSGGQQQRVSLARGLVARPDMILFDEPLSNLDARLREDVRAQLHELHHRLRFTTVFVTHDQSEALALADRVAIMRVGRFEQIGTPTDVFERPATEYVADFIGLSNRMAFERRDGSWVLDGEVANGHVWDGDDATVIFRIRPEDLHIASDRESLTGMTTFDATVADSQFGGRHLDLIVSVGEHRLHARIGITGPDDWARTLDAGDRVVVGFRRAAARVYGAEEGSRLMADAR